MMTEREAMGIVALVVAAYPVPAWPVETIKLYAVELAKSRAEVEPARLAARQWYLSRKDRPSISELLAVTSQRTHETRKALERRVGAAQVFTLPSPEERERNKQRVHEIVDRLARKIGMP
jgi:hypothetical protein